MEYMPFKCPKCLNWYTPVPMPEDLMCATCAEGKHAVNNKTGLFDCHWGHVTATNSEVKMAVLFELAKSTEERTRQAASEIAGAKSESGVRSVLGDAERLLSQLERGLGDVPEILRWAGVKEMPGLAGDVASRRFKSLEALEELVAENRRPQTDVDEMKRSIKTCNGLADELAGTMASVRVALAGVRRAAEHWEPPVSGEPVLSKSSRAVKARSHKANKRQAVGVS